MASDCRNHYRLVFTGKHLSVNVLPYTPHEIENATHVYELPPVYYTVVRIALKQMGVAGDDILMHGPCQKPPD